MSDQEFYGKHAAEPGPMETQRLEVVPEGDSSMSDTGPIDYDATVGLYGRGAVPYGRAEQASSYDGSFSQEYGATQRMDAPYGSSWDGGSYASEYSYGQAQPGYDYQAGQRSRFERPGGTSVYQGYDRASTYGEVDDSTYYSNTSYVNSSPNAQVVGYSKRPGRMIDLGPKKRFGKKKRSRKAKKNERMNSQPSFVSMQGKPSRKGRRPSGFAGSLLRLLLALALIVALPLGIYCFMLDQALAIPADQRAAVNQVLQPAGFGKPYYILVLGSDSREGSEYNNFGDSERSDVIMLLRMDPWHDQVTMVSVPRDTPYRLEDGTLVKINETYNQGGAAYTIKAVSEVTGVPISHCIEVGFSDLEAIVDILGGVTVDVGTELGYTDALTGEWVTIPTGTQTLNGQQAQVFARARHDYVYDQDANRQNSVRTLAKAIVDGITSKPLLEIPGTILQVAHHISTDMKSYNFASMALSMLLHPGKTTFYSCTGPYAGDINPETGLWLCYENPEGWANLMSVVDSGQDPSQVDLGY